MGNRIDKSLKVNSNTLWKNEDKGENMVEREKFACICIEIDF